MKIDYHRLYEWATLLAESYRCGKPFPHAVIADFADKHTYDTALDVFPLNNGLWKRPDNIHTKGKLVLRSGPNGLKETLLSERSRRLLLEFNTAPMLRFLEKLTGIDGLMGDPYLCESGYHQTVSGGFLDMHRDFTHHDMLGLERRVNLVWFLNDKWNEDWGGELRFAGEGDQYPKRLGRPFDPVTRVIPVGNTCAIFDASGLHGHPDPLRCPEGVTRKSLAMYYYTLPTGKAKKTCMFPNDPQFVHPPTGG